jgi:hypothetical protein
LSAGAVGDGDGGLGGGHGTFGGAVVEVVGRRRGMLLERARCEGGGGGGGGRDGMLELARWRGIEVVGRAGRAGRSEGKSRPRQCRGHRAAGRARRRRGEGDGAWEARGC